jgi:hypothetical protein
VVAFLVTSNYIFGDHFRQAVKEGPATSISSRQATWSSLDEITT